MELGKLYIKRSVFSFWFRKYGVLVWEGLGKYFLTWKCHFQILVSLSPFLWPREGASSLCFQNINRKSSRISNFSTNFSESRTWQYKEASKTEINLEDSENDLMIANHTSRCVQIQRKSEMIVFEKAQPTTWIHRARGICGRQDSRSLSSTINIVTVLNAFDEVWLGPQADVTDKELLKPIPMWLRKLNLAPKQSKSPINVYMQPELVKSQKKLRENV